MRPLQEQEMVHFTLISLISKFTLRQMKDYHQVRGRA